MKTTNRRFHLFWIALVSILALVPSNTSLAQENPPPKPVDIPCASGVSAQVLGSTPVNDGTQALVSVRIIFAPGGTIDAHTHPGTLVVTVESGSLGFTPLEHGEMTVTRAATADAEAVTESMPMGVETAVNAGDFLVETGMVHTGVNLADGPTTVLLSGLIEPGQPLTQCVEDATPAA